MEDERKMFRYEVIGASHNLVEYLNKALLNLSCNAVIYILSELASPATVNGKLFICIMNQNNK